MERRFFAGWRSSSGAVTGRALNTTGRTPKSAIEAGKKFALRNIRRRATGEANRTREFLVQRWKMASRTCCQSWRATAFSKMIWPLFMAAKTRKRRKNQRRNGRLIFAASELLCGRSFLQTALTWSSFSQRCRLLHSRWRSLTGRSTRRWGKTNRDLHFDINGLPAAVRRLKNPL